jgi:predicted dehydrogenase
MMEHAPMDGTTRRDFLHSSAALSAGLLARSAIEPGRSGREDVLRIALVGCGGRGTGAAVQALSTAGPTKLVAMADAFEDRLASSLETIVEHAGDEVDVPAERRFVGFDAYERAMALDLDVVILASPPGFRPRHFEHAVDRGLHVFMEKPVAVDAPGVRRVLLAGELAATKDLKVGVGLQRHHDPKYLETVRRLREGAIGDLRALRCYWNGTRPWVRPREAGWNEMQYQMRNWYYFNWLCGDHIVEQHIHNLDVCNWLMDDHPVEAVGMGGRQVRDDPEQGEIFDHHAVEYTYRDGTKMFSQCRQIHGCWQSVSEHATGTDGVADVSGARIESAGGWAWRYDEEPINPYQVEHDHLFAAIRAGTPYSEAATGAIATMTAVLGRMATYSGKRISWDEALESKLDLAPATYAWDAAPPVAPGPDGLYALPIPGVTRAL